MSAGDVHTCSRTITGAAYCWGGNASGQLGNGTTINSATPVVVSGALTFAAVTAGRLHSCAIGPTMYCWGDNASGQLGYGTTTPSLVPIKVSGQP
jgi:alpha-tubulin suppressor-like RCC1 family protein